MISEYDYYCPKCDGILSEESQVIFSVQREKGEKVKLFLDPKPGSYNVRCEPEMTFDEGEMVNFHCPHCNDSLESNKYFKFVEIVLKVTESVTFDVFFSRIYGVHKTYVGIEDFEEEYGEQIASH